MSTLIPTMLNDSVKRLTLEVTAHEAFEKKDFFMVYQPQVAVASGSVVGFEALIRWNFDGSFVPPDEFLPVIEEVGLMHDLSLWVLEQACQQNVDWQNAGLPPVSIAVNLPPSFILHVDCAEKVQSILRKTGLAAKYLEIELTENTFIGLRVSRGISVEVFTGYRSDYCA